MSPERTCPTCHAPLDPSTPDGLCPRCLIRNALDESSLPNDAPTTDNGPEAHATVADLSATLSRADLTAPLTDQPDTHPHSETANPTSIRYFGDYEIQKTLGKGGMGVVYKARQVSLNRPVALKMIKAGTFADEAELRRFQNEAEAVATLDHPGIVPIYEVGEHDGQKYFSMKLIEGGNLAENLSKYLTNPRAAAQLVAEAAEAVHHAHMRGILHRDLKPANILLDPEGRPHVTDFGLAKRVESDQEMTQSGAILGTPAYMSPEQAAGHRGTITTATDVYGFGAILYALLTGRAPFKSDSVVDTIDAVRNRPPEPPRKLNSGIPRNLETIALKCLEKDPRRRYTSTQALADDLRCWLDSRPIAARRVGSIERAWLWCKRKPAVAALTAGIAAALILGTLSVILIQRRANAALSASLNRETAANAELTRSRAAVQARYELALDAIRTFHTGVSEDFLLKEDKFKDLRNRLLKSAQDFYGKLGALLNGSSDFDSRRALAQSNFELAELTDKVGNKEEALTAHRAVLAAREALAVEQAHLASAKVDLAISLMATGSLLRAIGNFDEALAVHERAFRELAAVGSFLPSDPEARAAYATALSMAGAFLLKIGRSAEALAMMEQARAIREMLVLHHPAIPQYRADLAGSQLNIGGLLTQTGRATEAMRSFDAARTILETLTQDNPTVTLYRSQLASSLNGVGRVLYKGGRVVEAMRYHEAARAIREALVRDNPAVTDFRGALAVSHSTIGVLLLQIGRAAEGLRSYEASHAILEDLVRDNPAVASFRTDLAASHFTIGILQFQTGKTSEAMRSYEAARAIQEALVRDNPAVTDFRGALAVSHSTIGILQFQTGKTSEAMRSYDAARAIQEALVRDNPSITQFRSSLGWSHNRIGDLLRRTGKLAESLKSYKEQRAILEAITRDNPAEVAFQSNLATNHNMIGLLLAQSGKSAEAMRSHEAALVIQDSLVRDNPNTLEARADVTQSHNHIGNLLRQLGRWSDARTSYERALAIIESLAREAPGNMLYRAGPAYSLRGRGLARLELGDLAGAADDTRRALAIWDALPTRTGEHWFETACCHATLSALAGRTGSRVSVEEHRSQAEQAVAALRKAIATGYSAAIFYRNEYALDTIRNRDDVRQLMMDLEFPDDPFAP